MALGAEPGRRDVVVPGGTGFGGYYTAHLAREGDPGRRETVDVQTLDALKADGPLGRVDLVKCDVEGAELDVLEGIEDHHWPRIGAIVAEVHDVDGRLARIHGLLAAHGFADVRTEQDWINAGTDVFTVHALRGASTA
jgi:hypothetical protein